jgi:hypothetical protein
MNKDKKKLFEAFEKVCGVKLLKEQEEIIGEVESLKEYMLEKLSLDLDLVPGIKKFDDKEFEFELNNKKYTGFISLIVESELVEDPGTQYAPPSSELVVKNIEISYLNVGDDDIDIIVFDVQNQNHLDFIEKLEKEIELY